MDLPLSRATYQMRPEQSKPLGLEPPHTYLTPRCFMALATMLSPLALGACSVGAAGLGVGAAVGYGAGVAAAACGAGEGAGAGAGAGVGAGVGPGFGAVIARGASTLAAR